MYDIQKSPSILYFIIFRWFRDFNWKGLVYMTMKPPKTLIPSLCGPTDMANLADMRDDHSYVPLDEDSNWDKDFE